MTDEIENSVTTEQPQASDGAPAEEINLSASASPRPRFIFMPVLFGLAYLAGIPVFLSMWSGQWHPSGFAGFEPFGLVYALLCLFGLVCNVAVLMERPWGVVGQISVWLVAATLTQAILHTIDDIFVLGLILAALWLVNVYRSYR